MLVHIRQPAVALKGRLADFPVLASVLLGQIFTYGLSYICLARWCNLNPPKYYIKSGINYRENMDLVNS